MVAFKDVCYRYLGSQVMIIVRPRWFIKKCYPML